MQRDSKCIREDSEEWEVPKTDTVHCTKCDERLISSVPRLLLQEIYEAYFWFFKRCEEYFLCKYQPPEGVASVGQHIELEVSIYLQRFPPQQRQLRKLIFDYLLKRECCITGTYLRTEEVVGLHALFFLCVVEENGVKFIDFGKSIPIFRKEVDVLFLQECLFRISFLFLHQAVIP